MAHGSVCQLTLARVTLSLQVSWGPGPSLGLAGAHPFPGTRSNVHGLLKQLRIDTGSIPKARHMADPLSQGGKRTLPLVEHLHSHPAVAWAWAEAELKTQGHSCNSQQLPMVHRDCFSTPWHEDPRPKSSLAVFPASGPLLQTSIRSHFPQRPRCTWRPRTPDALCTCCSLFPKPFLLSTWGALSHSLSHSSSFLGKSSQPLVCPFPSTVLGLKTRRWHGFLLVEPLRGESVSVPFPTSSDCPCAWAYDPSTICKE